MRSLALALALALVACGPAAAQAHDGAHAMSGPAGSKDMAQHMKSHAAGETGRAGAPVARPDVVVQVNGLVCDFCARGLEKTFRRTGKVSGISVDLTAKEIRLKFVPGAALDDAVIRKLVRDAGYAAVAIRRPAA